MSEKELGRFKVNAFAAIQGAENASWLALFGFARCVLHPARAVALMVIASLGAVLVVAR